VWRAAQRIPKGAKKIARGRISISHQKAVCLLPVAAQAIIGSYAAGVNLPRLIVRVK
jgi:hypothetical protein